MTKTEITWFVVADGGKARILTRHGTTMTTISHFDADGHGDTSENDVAEISHIQAPKTNPREQVKTLFAHRVAEHLNKAVLANEISGIVVAAPGHVLHDIRDALNKPATAILTQSISKDLTNIPEADLGSYFN